MPKTAPDNHGQAEASAQRIAREVLFLDTLETRGRDHLDFHDLAVWSVKQALLDAYAAGRNAERNSTSS